MSIALHPIGAELHTTEAYLQWLVSTYPLSSVRHLLRSIIQFDRSMTTILGMSPAVSRTARGSLWTQACVFRWVRNPTAFILGCGFAKGRPSLNYVLIEILDEFSLAVLRGLQGIGDAAVIHASVRAFVLPSTLILTCRRLVSWLTRSRPRPAHGQLLSLHFLQARQLEVQTEWYWGDSYAI